MIFLVTLLSPIVIGYLIAQALLPTLKPAWAGIVLRLSLGAGCGAGLLSLLYFAVWLTIGPSVAAYWTAEICLLAAALAGCRLLRERATVGTERPVRGWGWLLAAVLAAVFLIHAARFLHVTQSMPQGGWDAWAIWNLRAKFLAQLDATWRGAFSPFLGDLPGGNATHPDYPLLLSGYVARGWALTDSIDDVTVPMRIGALFWAATVGVLVSGLAVLRGWTAGALGGLLLLANTSFAGNAPTQYADVPLAFFMLATIVLLLFANADRDGPGYSAALAGFAAGCAAWTKDEGQLFALATGAALLVCVLLRKVFRKHLILFAAGAAAPLAATVYFKVFLAPADVSWGALSLASAWRQIAEPARYSQIFAAFGNTLWSMGTGVGIALLLLLLGVSMRHLRSPLVIASFATCGAMFAGYFGAYLITPQDLTWHLSTSLDRVLTQLVPASTFLLVAVCRTAEETEPAPASRQVPAKKRKRG